MPPKNSETEARKLFERRRNGLDRKARDLIMKEFKDFGVPVAVTIIYEYRDEVALFRSHLDDGPWWSSVRELRQASGNRFRDMGVVTPETQDLLNWQNAYQGRARSITQASPNKIPNIKSEMPEDILASCISFQGPEMEHEDDISANGSDFEGTSCSDTETHSIDDSGSDEAEESCRSSKLDARKTTYIGKAETGSSRRQSKRPLKDNNMAMQWAMPEPQPPTIFESNYPPTFNYVNGPNQIPMTNQPHNLYGNMSQHSPAAVTMLPQSQHPISLNQHEVYGGTFPASVGMVNDYSDSLQAASMSHRPSEPLEAQPSSKKRLKKSSTATTRKSSSRRRKAKMT